MSMRESDRAGAGRGTFSPVGADVVEIPLLLPGWQATALEVAAHRRGLTAGQVVRHLIKDFLHRSACSNASPGPFSENVFAPSTDVPHTAAPHGGAHFFSA